jgi:hypothetical protein
LDTSKSGLPHKGFANARLAFEGAQQALVLATHEDYVTAGARAWVFRGEGCRLASNDGAQSSRVGI